MRILITGITGFVGSHLAEYILKNQTHCQVYGVIRPRSDIKNIEHIKKDIQVVQCDLMDADAVKNMIEDIKPDRIFHLAAQSDVAFSFKNAQTTLNNNIISQLNILDAVVDLKNNDWHGRNTRVHIAGTSEEYGDVNPEDFPLRESQPLKPLSPYAVSKVAQENLAYQYFKSYGVNTVVTRAFNHTGPRRGSNFAESSFAKQIAEGNVVKHGNLESHRDYTDVRDVVRAYWLALERGKSGEVYNVCSGESYSMKEILDFLIKISGKKIECEVDESRMRPSDLVYLWGDYTKFRVQTGWSPEISINTTLKDLYNYHKNAKQ